MSKVLIDDLPKITIWDIVGYLSDTMNWGMEEDIHANLLDMVDEIYLPLKTVPLRSIRMDREWGISDVAVQKYAALSPRSVPPVLVIGNKLVEGGHRVRAARARGDKTIQVVDISDLIKLDWQAYLNGAPVPPALRKPSPAKNLITQTPFF